MLTILEGPDGGGKTTFTEHLRQSAITFDPRMDNHGPYLDETDIALHYQKSIDGARSRGVVMDRSWISEPIYGAAARGGVDRIGVAYRRMLERGSLSVGGVVVLFLPPFERCRAAFESRPEDEYLKKTAQLARVYEGFLDLIQGGRPMALPYVVADWTRMTPAGIAGAIDAARPPANPAPGLGRYSSRSVVLVGDRPGKSRDAVIGPFVQYGGRDGCSAWIAETLEEAEIPESSLYWVNAFDRNGQPADLGWLSYLQPRGVIALGKSAEARLMGTDIPWVIENLAAVDHPQYHKRFHHREPYELVDNLKELLR